MSAVNATISTIRAYQGIFTALSGLALTSYRFPTDTETNNLRSSYDFIVIGAGTAGGVVASRITENEHFSVLLVEAGPVSPLECMLPGLFAFQPNSPTDWNQPSTDDGNAAQNLLHKYVDLIAGKMLSGSSCLEHMVYVRGNKYDYSCWVKRTGDKSWSYRSLLPYFKMIENTLDEDILNDHPSYHSTCGPLKLKKQTEPANIPVLKAFREQGHKIISDINADETLGYTEPQFTIADGYRQSTGLAYLSPAKSRKNLQVKYNTLVTRIIFNNDHTAIGVEIEDNDGVKTTIKATKEVILSAGAINSVKLLMVSGIGPKEQLESLNIPVVADLPVGKTLYDHLGAITAYALGKTTKPRVFNPHEFPVPLTSGYVSLDSTLNPTYQALPLLFIQGSPSLLQFCSWVLKYKPVICEKINSINMERDVLLSVNNILHPVSKGNVQIVSTDPSVNAKVTLGYLSNKKDQVTLARSLMDLNTVLETPTFKSYNSTLIDIDLPNCKDIDKSSFEYWMCYAKEMSNTMWHYSGTCPMGSVLNSDTTVKKVNRLRVVDASAMPCLISGNIKAAVYVIAEKASAMIKKTYT